MRSAYRTRLIPALAAGGILMTTGCGDAEHIPVPGADDAVKSIAAVRADRRAYDGAPPTVPHTAFGMRCSACHNSEGQSVPDIGFAPASPHEATADAGATTRCQQCHVFRTTDAVFVDNTFAGLAQDLEPGSRATPGAPPTIPHRTLMRENCVACHDGPGAREEIRTSHPERTRCRQCHVPVTDRSVFQGLGLPDTAGTAQP